MSTRLKTNYHTHTVFCDGKAEAVCYAEKAATEGLTALGFSAHAPVNFPTAWTISPVRVSEYHAEIQRLKKEYAGRTEIYCGLEADFFPDILNQVQTLYSDHKWDYIIGSIHFIGIRPDGRRWCIDGPHEEFRESWRDVANNDPFLPVQRYFEYTRQMVQTMKPDIIGHMDKIKMQYRPDCLIPEDHPFYTEQLMNTLEEIAASDCVVEINTRGIQKGQTDDFYPGSRVFREMYRMNIPVTISSDAHSPDMLTFGYDRAAEALKNAGYRTITIWKDGVRQESPL